MPRGFGSSLARFGVIAGIGVVCVSPLPAKAAESWPTAVNATYDVNFNGLNVGTYDFSSTREGHNYKLNSNAQLSLLLGALRWSGATEASGHIAGDVAKPAKFGFEFKAQSKAGSTQMSFTDDTVTQVLHNPQPKIKEGVIPVQTQHLKGVFDPLTAVMAMTHGNVGNPCSRRIPIYDGTQRFDIVLSPKGQVPMQEGRSNGQSSPGYACRVKYIPIAGYKPDDGTKYLAQNNDIEIVLRPLPSANTFVPYRVTIPTIAGNATLVARRVNVVINGQQQIAVAQ